MSKEMQITKAVGQATNMLPSVMPLNGDLKWSNVKNLVQASRTPAEMIRMQLSPPIQLAAVSTTN
jgi:hypothetical protein